MAKLNYRQTLQVCIALIRAKSVPLVIGPPGNGKTAMGLLIANAIKLPLGFFNPSDHEPHEIGGIPCPDGKGGMTKLFSAGSVLLRACQEPMLIVIDELNAQGPAKFSACARIMHERKVGDHDLHPDTRIVAFTNSQAQSLDGSDLPLPCLNRMSPVEMECGVDDFQSYLATYGAPDSAERMYATELSGFLESKPGLLEIDPSKLGEDRAVSYVADIVANNSTWASPRAWEKLIMFRAEHHRTRSPELTTVIEEVGEDIIASLIGPRQAKPYLRMLREGKLLPTVGEIVADPTTAKLPPSAVVGLSLAALLPAVGKCSPDNAWIYVDRLTDPSFVGGAETARQLYRSLTKHCPLTPKSSAIAKKIQAKMALSVRGDAK